MNDRFKFRAVLRTKTHSIVADCDCVSCSQYYIDLDDCMTVFKDKYANDCFWDFLEKIKKQKHIQEISKGANLIITNTFKNLMQCTGLKDKNDKPIFEGDVLAFNGNKNDIGVVKYGEFLPVDIINESQIQTPSTGFYYEPQNIQLEPFCWNVQLAPFFLKKSKAEVIGNIYENPELLEVK